MNVPLAGRHRARITARLLNPVGNGWTDLSRVGFAPIGRSVRFAVTTDAEQPYEIWSKVRNHGRDAENARALRGQIVKSRGS